MKKKKVLIVTYYWPPSAGGGVQRWLKFAKYLPEYDWQPIILTPENPDYALQDESLQNQISNDLSVIKLKIWEPYSLLRLINTKSNANTGVEQKDRGGVLSGIIKWVRGNLFIPDPRVFWVRPAVRYLNKYIIDNTIDVIITTGPPHSMHLIGKKIKENTSIKWIMDVRDPWSQFDLLQTFKPSEFVMRKYLKLERSCLNEADHIMATSPSMKHFLEPFNHQKFTAITNGYDADDFSNYKDNSSLDKLIIYHGGLIQGFRNPQCLWDVLSEMCLESSSFRARLEIRLAGEMESGIKQHLVDNEVLSSCITFLGYINHDQVIEELEKANVLLLLVNNTNNSKVNIPGKVFEYIASRKPILCLSPKNTDVFQVLSKIENARVFRYNDRDSIAAFVGTTEHMKINSSDRSRYSRRFLTKRLVDVLDNL